MKSIFTFCTILLFASFSLGQTFFELATDPSGDPTQSVNDVERFSVAFDASKDSLWFRVDFHNTISGDFGFVFGLDTDQDPSTGSNAWNGVQSGLNCDEIIIVNRNSFDPSFFYGSSTYSNLGELTTQLNDTSVLVAMKLSTVDSDGSFNLIMGSGFFDAALTNRRVYDEAPTTGWVSVSPTVGNEPILAESDLRIFPNPTSNTLTVDIQNWQSLSEGTISLTNAQGQLIERLPIDSQRNVLNVRQLSSGIYTLNLHDTKRLLSKKVLIQ